MSTWTYERAPKTERMDKDVGNGPNQSSSCSAGRARVNFRKRKADAEHLEDIAREHINLQEAERKKISVGMTRTIRKRENREILEVTRANRETKHCIGDRGS